MSNVIKNTLVVSPPSQYINLARGETYSGTIQVANTASSTEAMNVAISVVPYSVAAGDYSADFSTDSAYTNIADWVTIDMSRGSLKPNETRTIHYTINVPDDAPAGGQYCAITIRNDGSDASGVINDIIEIASIIYAKVDGEVTESGELLAANIPSIVFTPPITTSLTFSNTGNVHLNALINTEITNFWTGDVIFDSREQKKTFTETVMPETTRLANYTFDGIPELGVFRVEQTVVYNGEKTTIDRTIFVCPIWFMILVLITISAIITFVVRRIVRMKNKRG